MNNVKNYTEIGNVGRFIIPEKMKKKIDILHREVGSTEWSGILVYKTLVKSVRSLKDLAFKGEDIFPMDVGTAAATGFKYDGNVVDVYTNIPKALEMNIGTVHSHHGMSSFFSATDMDDIADNAKHYNYYISLVVSFDGKYKCKIAIPTKTSVTSVYKFRDRDGKIKTSHVETQREDVIVGDLSVIVESNYSADQWFMDRIAEIKKKAVYVKKPSVAKVEKSPVKSVKSASLWDDDLDLFTINSLSFNNFTKEEFKNSKLTIYQVVKTIEEMDDLEFEGYVDSLERNVSLVHYDVYGPNRVFEEVKHVQHIIDTLKSYKYISTVVSNRINEITECLQDSIAYERESGYQCEI